ncbi:filamentous hemagglutinin N-terminal domain-containing protein [Noviherbaspirillum cavernae]|uniref:Filamentous hemagglutinin N-terminal domain-containing protein n=1 Tax=Noviherbaspirillum cavernae TaxID=2320862 RepID=A0A418WYW9_9BURK|nr:YDG domain-containing protein [Noviherbaspirillum cavernae]RJG05293.1 filamentous hemagglutinin N-terminal domain-containing protein [Noviherbaspirillum cavernae]
MNRIYRLIWNTTLNLWTVVAENARGRGKGGSSRSSVKVGSVGYGGVTLLAALAFFTPQAQAADAANAAVVAGTGNVSTVGNATTITQGSQRLAIDWLNLSTAAGEALIFNQPNAQAIALNRITGTSPSELLGSLTANGQVFILNPNGVLFGAGSQVNVGGLVASTLSMSNADFMAGNNVLAGSGNGSGSVVNRGTLNASPGGYLALLAPEVRNEGVMTASLGTALLAAGNKVTLNLDNGSLLGYSIDQGAINALAENRQLIRVDGGQVLLSAKAADALTTAAVNNTGVIEARTMQNKAGRIMLMGDMETGTVNVGGTLDASAPNGGNGGFIETSAAHVKVAEGAQVTTKAGAGTGGTSGTNGNWLIDPHDFTIAAVGGDISGATLSGNLTNGNVEILSSSGSNASGSGDINVNDVVGWSANTLTLTAARNVNINAVMSATGSAGLSMNTGTANGADPAVAGGSVNVALTGNGFLGRVDFSGSGALTMNGDVYTVIQDVNALQAMANNLSGKYVLGSNIDASVTSSWDGAKGFLPVGTQSADFTGRFDGLGHTISNLFINRIPSTARLGDVGLFGYTRSGSSIRNVGMTGASINGYYNVGALVGMNFGSISNSYSTGSVGATNKVGGLVGTNFNGSITNSYSTATVNGTEVAAGGLVASQVGTASITNSYATGAVRTRDYAGGLVGTQDGGTITNSYATGAVTAGDYGAGGLVGANNATINNSYATGAVTGVRFVGGLVGKNGGGVNNSFWNTQTSGQAGSEGGTGVTTAQMQQASTFAGWDMATQGGSSSAWRIYDGNSMPLLRGFLTSLTLADTTATYNGTTQTGVSTATAGVVGSAASGSNAGFYNSGYYSTQQGYDISGGGLTINKATVTVTGAVADNKTYDGSTTATLSNIGSLSGLVGGETLTLSQTGTATFGDKNAGSGKTVTATGYSLADGAGGLASNYQLASTSATTTADIGKATVTVTGATANNKTYDGGTSATLSNVGTLSGLVGGEALTLSQTGATFADKNAGSGKIVTITGYSLADGAGGLAGNYQLASTTATTTGDITPKALSYTTTAADKTYDGNTTASVVLGGLTGFVGSETVTVSSTTASFNSKDVASANLVTVNSAILANGSNGGLASNYTIAAGGTAAASINKATVTVGGAVADSKTYDGSTTATLSNVGTLSGLVSGEALTLSQTGATYADKNAGSGKTVTATGYSLADGAGGLAGNYQLASTSTTTTADIGKATVTVTGAVADNKTYDGGTSATLSNIGTLSGLVGGEALTLSQTGAAFADKNAGSGKTVTATGYSLADGAGGLAGNYQLASTSTTTTADIGKATVTVTGATADNKTYDGGTSATLSSIGSLSGLVGGEALTLSQTGAAFADKNAGSGKTVTATGYSLADGAGGLAGNYQLASTSATTTADIGKATVTVIGAVANNKTYDGGTSATLSNIGTLSGLVGGEALSLSQTGAAFADKNAGSGKTVTLTGYSLADGAGGLAGNYQLASTSATTTADIGKATVTVTGATANNKTYDGGTSATLSNIGTLSGLVGGEALSLSQTGAAFADKNAGSGKTVTLTGYSLADGAGGLAGNYQLASTSATTTADIGKATVTVTGAVADNKTYDGSTAATLSSIGMLSGLVGGEALTLSQTGTATFADKNAGSGKTVTATGYSLADGAGGLVSNYQLASTSATTTADINQLGVTVAANTANKSYDGTTASTTALASSGILAGDTVNFGGSALFADKNAGNGKVVSVTGISASGTDAGNYSFNSTASTTANIDKANLIVTANNDNKLATGAAYSGGNGVIYSGFVAGETPVELTGSLIYRGSAQGASTVGTYTIAAGGLEAGNYTLNFVNGVLTVSYGSAAATAVGNPALVASYDGALQAVSGLGSSPGGNGGGGSVDAMAGALAAAAAEAGNDEDK